MFILEITFAIVMAYLIIPMLNYFWAKQEKRAAEHKSKWEAAQAEQQAKEKVEPRAANLKHSREYHDSDIAKVAAYLAERDGEGSDPTKRDKEVAHLASLISSVGARNN